MEDHVIYANIALHTLMFISEVSLATILWQLSTQKNQNQTEDLTQLEHIAYPEVQVVDFDKNLGPARHRGNLAGYLVSTW